MRPSPDVTAPLNGSSPSCGDQRSAGILPASPGDQRSAGILPASPSALNADGWHEGATVGHPPIGSLCRESSESPGRGLLQWAGLAFCLAAFITLRSPGLGHLPLWDEAIDACSIRALAAGADDWFARQFWLAPPMLGTLALPLNPAHPAFIVRFQMLVLVLNAGVMVALFFLNRRIFGPATAFWSCLFLAAMPGSVFFGVWTKGGPVASLATLAAVAALVRMRPLYVGLSLGIALLDKETALLSCGAVALLLMADRRQRSFKAYAGIACTALFTAAWWYMLLSSNLPRTSAFLSGKTAHAAEWLRPWHAYAGWLRSDLGGAGCIVLIAGAAVMSAVRRAGAVGQADPYRWWPAALLVPSVAVLSCIPAKMPWLTVSLHPALATVQGVGIATGIGALLARFGSRRGVRYAVYAAATLCAVAVLWLGRGGDYAHRQAGRLGAARVESARRSQANAGKVNAHVPPNQRMIASTFSYLGSNFVNRPCAVFAYYCAARLEDYMPYTIPFMVCEQVIIQKSFDWTIVAPAPGAATEAFIRGFRDRHHIEPIPLDGAMLFLTTNVFPVAD